MQPRSVLVSVQIAGMTAELGYAVVWGRWSELERAAAARWQTQGSRPSSWKTQNGPAPADWKELRFGRR